MVGMLQYVAMAICMSGTRKEGYPKQISGYLFVYILIDQRCYLWYR